MDKKKTALVLIDMQKESKYGIKNVDGIVQKTKKLINTCREHNIPIIYTRQYNRSDQLCLPEKEPLDDKNKPLYYCSETENVEVIDDIKPAEEDIVIDKYRWSGFYGTSLDLILKDLGVSNIIFGGFVTEGCVMSTVVDAFFRDYEAHLVKDICSASNEGAHMSSILIMSNWINNIHIYNNDGMIKNLNGESYNVWTPKHPDSMPFSSDNMRDVFNLLDEQSVSK